MVVSRLRYRINLVSRSSLSLHIEESSSSRKRTLYLSTLKELATEKDKPFLEALVRFKKKQSVGAFDTISFNQTDLSFRFALEAIPLFIQTGSFYIEKSHVERQESAKLYWEGEKEEGGAWLSAFLWGEKKLPISDVLFSFYVQGTWVALVQNCLFVVPFDGSLQWLESAKKGSFFLSGSVWHKFLEEEFPVLWKESIEPEEIDVFPRLILHDEMGSFASLEMYYPHLGTIAFEDPCQRIGVKLRRKEEEKKWEKDLIEAGYMPKCVGKSSYYCPGDQVAEALPFLLEIGWDITAYNGKRAVIFSEWDCKIEEEDGEVLLSGSPYLEKAFQAVREGSSWIEYNDRSAWIDQNELKRRYGDLLDEAWEGGTLKCPKSKLSLCLSFVSPDEKSSSPIYQTLRRFSGFDSLESVAPGLNFQADLLGYQKEGLNWLFFLHQNEVGGLLADEMGLGKTVQVLAFFSRLKRDRPALVIVPTSLLYHWAAEVRRFLPAADYFVYAGKERRLSWENGLIVLTSYAVVRQDVELLSSVEFETIVLDESSAIKNQGAQITKAVMQLKAQSRFCLCGTPIENRLDELKSQFSFLMPSLFRFSDSLDVLRRKCRPFLLRRRKNEVHLDLPEKIDQMIWLEMEGEQKRCYEMYQKSAVQRIRPQVERDGPGFHRMEILEAILRLRQICCDPRLVGEEGVGAKIERLKIDIEEWQREGAKVLVFSQFTSMLDQVEELFPKEEWPIGRIDGQKSAEERSLAVEAFQCREGFSLLLLSLKAGGVGLNLTQADAVVLLDPWWNEAVENQAIDRAHRIGRKKSVFIKRYLTPNSIEEKMLSLKESKLKIAQELFDEQAHQKVLSDSEWFNLLLEV